MYTGVQCQLQQPPQVTWYTLASANESLRATQRNNTIGGSRQRVLIVFLIEKEVLIKKNREYFKLLSTRLDDH